VRRELFDGLLDVLRSYHVEDIAPSEPKSRSR
jgi:hypothetical protein